MKRNWLIISLLEIWINLAYSGAESNYWQEFSKAKVLIEQNRLMEAIPILEKLNQIDDNYNVEISLGDAYSELENPSKALNYYEMAYRNAKNENNVVIERVALFKIARTNMWLKRYQEAANSYQRLLSIQLSEEDRAIANAGLKTAQGNLPTEEGKDNTEIALGDAAAAQENPSEAFTHYNAAYENAKKENNMVIERVALFKIARTNMWLKRYQEAVNSYQHLLAMQLSEEDRAIANAGLKTALKNLQPAEDNSNSEIALGDTASTQENPSEALTHYKIAYENAKKENNVVIERIALFRIARTNIWLKKYPEATDNYRTLLNMQLSNEDKAIAETGLNTIYHFELSDAMQKARDYINKNNGKSALESIKRHLNKEKNPHLYILAAQSMAIMENPKKSLEYFKQALAFSDKNSDKRAALLGMVKMQVWLNDIKSANQTLFSLKKFSLNQSEKKQLEDIKIKLTSQIAQLKFEQLLQQARQFISTNDGASAYSLIKGYIGSGDNYQVDMIAAESMTILNKPDRALYFYKQAFSVASNASEQVKALFGIAKMQFWLAWYVRAQKSYRLLLQYKLSPTDYELALAGLVKSLAYYDRPRLAYQMIPNGFNFTTPQAVIAASQATLWANWADVTKDILEKYYPITSKINLNSGLGKDLLDLRWQTNLATWPNVVMPSVFVSEDSETFNKRRTTLEYTHYWSQQAQTFLGPDYIRYKQHESFKLDAKGFYIGQILRPTRHLIFKGRMEPIEYINMTPSQRNHWNPFLWGLDGTYTPNDYVSVQLLTQKEVIETFPAFNHQITDNLYSASLNLNPLPYVKFNGAYSKLNMSDTNSRDGYFLSSSILIIPDLGVTVVGALREFSNKFRSPNYFSPHEYMEKKILLKLGRRLGATWHYYLDGGVGRQYITPDPDSTTTSSPTYQWGLGINGPITKCLFFTAYYANIHQASAFINSPDYSYQYGEISLNLLL
ncbi:tetratricopeptide repeat protein [Legionella norrlandica]|uniref:tetratricopeptide repeat protein n=1 Tax=Legionella norrlandica TaxID=1498499 RepID=UPI000ACD7981|nr:tetratricopeptide repeat protein [Legionella norrlandica]